MINSVCLIGNLAADPEIRSTPTGAKVAKMRIAVNEYWTNRQTGERNERTHWFALNAWEKMADTCERFLRRGMKIAVRGNLEYQEWSAQDGGKRSRIEVRVRELEILSPKGGESRSEGPARQLEDRAVQGSTPTSRDYHPAPTAPTPVFESSEEEEFRQMPSKMDNPDNRKVNADEFPPIEDDDIPF